MIWQFWCHVQYYSIVTLAKIADHIYSDGQHFLLDVSTITGHEMNSLFWDYLTWLLFFSVFIVCKSLWAFGGGVKEQYKSTLLQNNFWKNKQVYFFGTGFLVVDIFSLFSCTLFFLFLGVKLRFSCTLLILLTSPGANRRTPMSLTVGTLGENQR